jgi:hypothetical protein
MDIYAVEVVSIDAATHSSTGPQYPGMVATAYLSGAGDRHESDRQVLANKGFGKGGRGATGSNCPDSQPEVLEQPTRADETHSRPLLNFLVAGGFFLTTAK